MRPSPELECPFCGYQAPEYEMLVHLESDHPEGLEADFSDYDYRPSSSSSSPRYRETSSKPQRSTATGAGPSSSSRTDTKYTVCQVKYCEQYLPVTEMPAHLQLHVQQEESYADDLESSHRRHHGRSASDGAKHKNRQVLPDKGKQAVYRSKDEPSSLKRAPALPRDRETQSLKESRQHQEMQSQKEKWLDKLDRERKRDEKRRREKEKEKENSDRAKASSPSDKDKDKTRSRRRLVSLDEREEPRAMSLMRHIFMNRNSSKSPSATSSRKLSSSSSSSSPTHSGTQSPDAPSKSSKAEAKRLGVADLGLFAYEKKMPTWLHSLLERKGVVALQGMIGALEWHLNHSQSTSIAYLCHSDVQQVFKLRREGHFCGYRTIQAMSSYINATNCLGVEALQGNFPSVFQIQDMVERAWDVGINSHGRNETGGIKGTRKYIGTSEAEALFKLIGTPCRIQGFRSASRTKAAQGLLNWFLEYFTKGTTDIMSKVRQTQLPPVYLQNPAHSMMVVGVEREISGALNLIVFDPKFYDIEEFSYLAGKRSHSATVEFLEYYRRGMSYLGRHSQFETLTFHFGDEKR